MHAQHSYRQLAPLFFETVAPTPVANPQRVLCNASLAEHLGIADAELQNPAYWSGNQLAAWMQPTAQAYSGHQFGQLSPRLGDGRAILLAELKGADGQVYDVQLKGSGPTPYSRRGDGRAALGPVLREYLVSEWMFHAGVPTTRSLAAVSSGETLWRNETVPGAILTRVARSFLRIGTFQFAAIHGSPADVRQIADYAICRHYPELQTQNAPYLALLGAVADAHATLVARWMSLGFVHGVMNTDNMAISGETIDYGPCAFIDIFQWRARFSSIDENGRYAYHNQPAIAQWNLARLAETLLPLLADDEQVAIELAMSVLNEFPARYQRAWLKAFNAKLALPVSAEQGDETAQLIHDLLSLMEQTQADFTQTFRDLAAMLRQDMDIPPAWSVWFGRYQERLQSAQLSPVDAALQMDIVNPAFIPRNHLIEQMITQAQQGDYQQAKDFLAALTTIYQPHPEFSALPPADFTNYRTFCGT